MNWTGKVAEFFVKNGKLTFLILLSFFLWGAISFMGITKKYNPTIVAPAFQVRVDAPGASREEMLEQVTKPLENVITDIAGVEDVYSVTMRGGVSIVNVNFYVGEDLNAAKISLNDRLQSDMTLAPLGISTPKVTSIDPEEVPVITMLLHSKKLSPIQLRKLSWTIRDQLSLVEGTSRIAVYGGRKQEVSILLNQKKLEQYGISIQHIEEALNRNNLFLPSGYLKSKGQYTPIETIGVVSEPKEIEQVVLVTNDAINIRLGDVAVIKKDIQEETEYIRHISHGISEQDNIVLLSVSKLKGRNISDVTESIHHKIEEIKLPKDVKLEVIVDSGKTAKDEIDGLLTNLLQSIAIVIVILFFFLNLKAALLVAIAIPLTLFSVFGVALLADQSVNRITLFALILSLGMLVDNATVVIENIIRTVGNVKEVTQQTFINAVNEVGPGLFMSTVTTVLAFIPMAFISGMMGPYMGPIPFFVPAALILALFISYSINPWMASILIKKSSTLESDHKKQKNVKLMIYYKNFLHNLLSSNKKKFVFLSFVVLALLTSISFPAFKFMKFRMLPKANVDQFFIYVDLPNGSALENTLQVSRKLEKSLLAHKEVSMVQSYIGTPPITDFNGLFKGASSRSGFNQATLRVGLVEDSQRKLSSEELVFKLREELYTLINNNHIKLKLIEDPPGPPVLSTLLLRFQGENEKEIIKEAQTYLSRLKKVDQVVDLDISTKQDSETVRVIVDHFQASKAKIAPAQIVSTLNTYYSGKVVGIFHNSKNIEQEVIRLKFPREDRSQLDDLSKITLRNPLRISVPLSKLVKIEKGPTQPPLQRENHRTTVYLTGEMGERSVTYAGIDILLDLLSYKLSSGEAKIKSWDLFGVNYESSTGEDIRVSIGGEWELTLEVFRDLMIAMAVAILIIYFVLVGQFKSFAEPFIIMATIPLSILGVFPGFVILNYTIGEYFTATSMIGVIALAGIAVNNSIILLEYLNGLKSEEMDLNEALVEACATRLRPIALTTVTTMLGSMTILGDPVWSGLAWAIILGLGMSSTLILLVFPVIYSFYAKNSWPSFHRLNQQ